MSELDDDKTLSLWTPFLNEMKTQPKVGMQREKQRVIGMFEKSYLCEVLTLTAGNISQAAKMAEKERRSFVRLMKKYKLEREDFTPTGSTT